MAAAKESFNPIEEVEQKLTAGDFSHEEVEHARALWRLHLRNGVVMPNGERITISERDLHHAILDTRILRKPERIAQLLENAFELRTAHSGRRVVLSQWLEGEAIVYGYAIIDHDHHLITMHIINAQGLRKKGRRGEQLWRRDE